MSHATQFSGDFFWGQFQAAFGDTSTWVASTWTTWASSMGDAEISTWDASTWTSCEASGDGRKDTEATQDQVPLSSKSNPAKRTVLSSRSKSYTPKGEVEQFFEAEKNDHHNSSETTQWPVRFTFIHFEDREEHPKQDRPVGMVRQSSAPGVLCTVPFSEKLSPMERSHWMGNCKPCAFLHRKADGCRRGEECEFCHFCRPEELKNQQREKKRSKREHKKALTFYRQSSRGLQQPRHY